MFMEIKGKQWSTEEIAFLKDNYEKMKFKDLAEGLGRTIESIRSKLKRMGISKDPVIPSSPKNSIIVKGLIGKAAKPDPKSGRIPRGRKQYETLDHSLKKMIPVHIDSKTTIYIKEGEDPQAAREKYFARMAERINPVVHF
jgi:hypothetical protein